jgi:hypothetical protein
MMADRARFERERSQFAEQAVAFQQEQERLQRQKMKEIEEENKRKLEQYEREMQAALERQRIATEEQARIIAERRAVELAALAAATSPKASKSRKRRTLKLSTESSIDTSQAEGSVVDELESKSVSQLQKNVDSSDNPSVSRLQASDSNIRPLKPLESIDEHVLIQQGPSHSSLQRESTLEVVPVENSVKILAAAGGIDDTSLRIQNEIPVVASSVTASTEPKLSDSANITALSPKPPSSPKKSTPSFARKVVGTRTFSTDSSTELQEGDTSSANIQAESALSTSEGLINQLEPSIPDSVARGELSNPERVGALLTMSAGTAASPSTIVDPASIVTSSSAGDSPSASGSSSSAVSLPSPANAPRPPASRQPHIMSRLAQKYGRSVSTSAVAHSSTLSSSNSSTSTLVLQDAQGQKSLQPEPLEPNVPINQGLVAVNQANSLESPPLRPSELCSNLEGVRRPMANQYLARSTNDALSPVSSPHPTPSQTPSPALREGLAVASRDATPTNGMCNSDSRPC